MDSGPPAPTVPALGYARLLPPLGFLPLRAPFVLLRELFLRESGSWLLNVWVSIPMPHCPPCPGDGPFLLTLSLPHATRTACLYCLHSTSYYINLPAKVRLVKAMVFPVVMYGCESWTIKRAECQRIDAFELWCWRRLLRVPWTARRSNQSILKEISPEYSLEVLMLKLKFQYFGHLMRRTDSF